MYLVGLTGGIGSGKSTVARMLEKRGAAVIDADRLAREVIAPGTEGFEAVVARFGDRVLTAAGDLDRASLAETVFADPEARRDLNAIVHPRVYERITHRLEELDASGTEIVVLDVPLLVESGAGDAYGDVVVVEAPEDDRVRRLVEQRGMDPDDVRGRMRSQASDADRRAVAAEVIDNSGDLVDLEEKVDRVWQRITRRAREARE